MCSIFKYKNCVGRNFDYEVSYQEELRIIESMEYGNDLKIIGMCTGFVQDYPLMYDGMNEYGLCCGALAFEGNAVYNDDEEEKINIPAFDFVFQILSSFKSVSDVLSLIDDFNITNKQYSEDFPNSDLHWFISDKNYSIVVEQTKNGLKWFNGNVMTNNPPYDLQEVNYKTIKCHIGETDFSNKIPYSTRGLETFALSGDYTSMGRFERLSWLKEHLEEHKDLKVFESDALDIANSFHLLSSVEQIYAVTSVNDSFEYTIYSIVYDMKNLDVYYKFYYNIGVLTDNL